jgi:hypothetical protein
VTNVENMMTHIQANETGNHKFLHVIDLPSKEKPYVIRELNLMGINEMTLFPSIDGICRAFKINFFSRESIGPSIEERLSSLTALLKSSSKNN